MKYFIGAALALGVLLLIPAVQKFMMPVFEKTIVRLVKMVFKKFNFRRMHLSLLGSLSFTTLFFAIIPGWRWALGALLIVIAVIMQWVVPRWSWARKWMREIFFGNVDILDKDAPYADLVALFKLPLFALGVWIIIPWGVIWIDVIGIIYILCKVISRMIKAEKIGKEVVDDDLNAAESVNMEKNNLDATNVVGETQMT